MRQKLLLVLLLAFSMMFLGNTGCEPPKPVFDEITDSRDGQKYVTVKIGAQTWMAENLNYETDNSWCYNDDPGNCEIYGRLYEWETAKTACPPGWHLPNDAQWNTLTDYLGGMSVAGGKMKSTGTIEDGTGLWKAPNNSATNSSGFSGLPGGFLRGNFGDFIGLGSYAVWWSLTAGDTFTAWGRDLYCLYGDVGRSYGYEDDSFSVRCIKE